MPSLDEFAVIERLFAPLASGHPGALGLKDDVALLPGPDGMDWVITTDAIVADVHFFADDPPDLIARKLIRVNLSDLAAKGAVPVAILLTACFREDAGNRWMERFASGLKMDCHAYGIHLIGGDTVATPGPLTLSLTAFGKIATGSAILRSNARSGDNIWVSGTIGDSVVGLALRMKDPMLSLPAEQADWLIARYYLPQPRLALGQALVGIAHAGMDVSDGLIGDLEHICDASGVGAEVDAAQIPVSPAAHEAVLQGLDGGGMTLATAGDDYELLFTAAAEQSAAIVEIGKKLGLPLTCIGRIVEGKGVTLLDAERRPITLATTGYRHFGGDDPIPEGQE